MPLAEERKVRQSARKAGLTPGSDRFKAYVYSTLRKIKEGSNQNAARWKTLRGK